MSMSTDSTMNPCVLTGTNCTASITTPQFVDTSKCLCALEPSQASADSTTELWNCIGNVSDSGDSTGKWWYTLNSNSNLEGFTESIDSANDPPDLGKAYVLMDDGSGGLNYVVYKETRVDDGCTAKNDTQASSQYYGKRLGDSNSTESTSSGTSSSQSMTTVLPTPTATPLGSSSPANSKAASTNGATLKTFMLLGLCMSTFLLR